MPLKTIFVIALLLLVAGFGLWASGTKGNIGMNLAYPLSAAALKISVTISGLWFLLGALALIVGIALMLAAIARVLQLPRR